MGTVIFHNLAFGDIDLAAHFLTDQLVAQNLLTQVFTIRIKLHALDHNGFLEFLPGQLVLLLNIQQGRFDLLFRNPQVESLDSLLDQGLFDHAGEQLLAESTKLSRRGLLVTLGQLLLKFHVQLMGRDDVLVDDSSNATDNGSRCRCQADAEQQQ